ncbi:MAG: hypothetical protein HZA48_12850 [Planctomycetes bacterium]|nr:hypothetical protein [Planctomycetota bacterium]
MDWVYLILYFIVSAGAFWAGYVHIGRMRAGYWIPIAIACLLCICAFTALRRFPEYEFKIIPLFLGGIYDLINFIPFALLFMGVAARKTVPAFLSKEIFAIAIIIFSFGLYRASWIYSGTGVNPQKQVFSLKGYCAQTTGHTCGPASAVNFLQMYNIQATEAEMAKLSHTTYANGVNTAQLARAVAEKAGAEGLEVDVTATDWQALAELKRPCITFIKYTYWVDHVVVITGVDETMEHVSFIDPVGGNLKTYDKDIFLQIWRGQIIYIK